MSDEDFRGYVREMLGRIDTKLSSHVDAFEKHVEDDREAYKAIVGLREAQARQRGFLTAVGVMGSGLGAALGWLIEKTLGIGHH